MGYWEQNEEGQSFESREGEGPPLVWGDTPADIVGNAIDQIAAAFVMDVGRLPSRADIMAGLTFTTRVLRLPDRPEDCPEVAAEDIQAVDGAYFDAFHPQSGRVVAAEDRISEVMGRLLKPYEES